MASTPPDTGQLTREARTGREDHGQRGNKWWTLVAVCLGTLMLLLDKTKPPVNTGSAVYVSVQVREHAPGLAPSQRASSPVQV
jgi:hypothetical protein